MFTCKWIVLAVLAASLAPRPAIAGTYLEFDPPGAMSSSANGIDEKGDVAGIYFPSGGSHLAGYVRRKNGQFKSIVSDGNTVQLRAMNGRRQTTGYIAKTGPSAAFIADRAGHIEEFTVPGTDFADPKAINSNGDVAGTFNNSGYPFVNHGFLRHSDGSFELFDAPGAGTGDTHGTTVMDMNANRTVAGFVWDDQDLYHGFLRAPDGTFTQIDIPGEGMSKNQGTQVYGLNAKNAVTGTYRDAQGNDHGFIRTLRGKITTFDLPGSRHIFVLDITANGTVAGEFSDRRHSSRGFVRAPDGTVTVLDAPDAHPDTSVVGINEKGQVAGFYFGADFEPHSFIWTP